MSRRSAFVAPLFWMCSLACWTQLMSSLQRGPDQSRLAPESTVDAESSFLPLRRTQRYRPLGAGASTSRVLLPTRKGGTSQKKMPPNAEEREDEDGTGTEASSFYPLESALPLEPDLARGTMLGLLIGDALGAPFEGLTHQEIASLPGGVAKLADSELDYVEGQILCTFCRKEEIRRRGEPTSSRCRIPEARCIAAPRGFCVRPRARIFSVFVAHRRDLNRAETFEVDSGVRTHENCRRMVEVCAARSSRGGCYCYTNDAANSCLGVADSLLRHKGQADAKDVAAIPYFFYDGGQRYRISPFVGPPTAKWAASFVEEATPDPDCGQSIDGTGLPPYFPYPGGSNAGATKIFGTETG